MYIRQCFIGLLNANQGAFKGYVQKFINNAFTIIIQLLLVQFAIILLNGGHFVLCFVASNIALKTPLVIIIAIFLNTRDFKNNNSNINVQNNTESITNEDNLKQEDKIKANLKGLLEETDEDYLQEEIKNKSENVVTTKNGETIIIKD